MNGDEAEITKIGMEIALRSVTAIAEDALGCLGGNWLREVRARIRAKLTDRTEQIFASEKVRLRSQLRRRS
jgi:hypothetical protein